MLTGPSLLERFQALDAFLLSHQGLWRPRPFNHLQLPWEAEHAKLARWLRGRSLEAAEAADNHPELLAAPAPFPQLAARAMELAAVGELPAQPRQMPPARFSHDVPGRKWQQIEVFAQHLNFDQAPRHWLDWCSGKGHLGHLLAWQGGDLTCLEHDPELVESGRALSQRRQLAARHINQDVLAADAGAHVHPHQTPVALHACGDLHVRLIQLASAAGCAQMAIAPCCYNRIAAPTYQPLSATAQASALELSREDLGLPLSETVTAGARVRRQRDTSMARRLAFDLLQRELRGGDAYLPTPSLPSAWLQKDFRSYCEDLAALKALPIPGTRDWAALEAAGWQRLAAVRNLELLRGLFRRPLEIWLLLDRALFLQELGYRVSLGSFCPAGLSPRNLLLLAEREQVAHTFCG
ncbi:SAM-dependent methyltransferase [Pseudomonas sp. LS44]|uniref:SAM-dependent methyltransferase n=1 Tax=Pseudomonas sp. LS44 TaxID=1357074 RepID=UPI00215A5570|nr:SAM-dependent methyltransferase [Pseudomonas sp. LS44]UVE17573.1 SAM-dependent methyltransferase [Pseudomonas sp. LS44]